jgi:hypothetical protein
VYALTIFAVVRCGTLASEAISATPSLRGISGTTCLLDGR